MGSFVTIFSDASHDGTLQRATYGIWIKRTTFPNQFSGVLRDNVFTSNEAELLAAVNAVYLGLKNDLICKGDKVLIQLDNTRALHMLQRVDTAWRHTTLTKLEQRGVDIYREIRKINDLTIRAKHIKGHSGTATPRKFVHNICDRLARAEMKKLRAFHAVPKKDVAPALKV